MKERPILMSAPMVRACLREVNPKTVTRRIVKNLPERVESITNIEVIDPVDGWVVVSETQPRYSMACPYGQPGDRLWVRETWGHDAESLEHCRASQEDAMGGSYGPYYRATEENAGSLRWRPSIHMPRWASRLSLEITGVKVERLQDISEDDAIREGATWRDFGRQCGHFGGWRDVGICKREFHPRRNGWTMEPPAASPDFCMGSARMAFANLINKINGPETWDANPWVWCVSFRRVRP